MSKETVVVVCPGRGTYNQSELGYLDKYHLSGGANNEQGCEDDSENTRDKEILHFLEEIDQERERLGQKTITELDSLEKYRSRIHGTGDNASALIYACALADFKKINRDKYDIVAITGNSMGWYLALACGGVLEGRAGFDVVNTMGTLMHRDGTGGQVIYPLVDSNWQYDPALAEHCEQVVFELNQDKDIEIAVSIELGGMRIFAANDQGVRALLENLHPQQERFPFQLNHHSAFHSHILNHIPNMAMSQLGKGLFSKVKIPLVDGQGKIWKRGAFEIDELYEYTFNQQITQAYNFSASVEVCIKEFSPDKVIVLGPGTTLGPPIAQQLIAMSWLDFESKDSFIKAQKKDPFLLSMGIPEQRAIVTS